MIYTVKTILHYLLGLKFTFHVYHLTLTKLGAEAIIDNQISKMDINLARI